FHAARQSNTRLESDWSRWPTLLWKSGRYSRADVAWELTIPSLAMLTLLTVAIIGGVCVYGMSPEDRLRLLRTIDTFLRHVVDGATRSDPDDERFRAALRARTPWPFVTIGLVTLNVTVFVC